MIWVLLVLVTGIGGTGWYLFYRSAKALLGFDSVFDQLIDILGSYAADLSKMSGGDVLIDHPEVRAFHKRNILALEQINGVLEDMKKGRPEAPKGELPRPDVE